MSSEKVYFEEGFVPAEHDIIVGRQKAAQSHSGNLRFVEITNSFLEDYRQSTDDKSRKSQILARTFDAIRGRFVKYDSKEKKWFQVTNSVARERISQQYRDSLKDCYKSSLAHKKKRRLVKSGVLPADDPSLQIVVVQPPTTGQPDPKRRKVVSDGVQEAEHKPMPLPCEGQDMDGEGSKSLLGSSAEMSNHGPSAEGPTDNLPKKTDAEKEVQDTNGTPFLPRDGVQLMEADFEPHNNDIIVGLRKRSQQHPGNIRLVEVVKQYLEEYKKCGNNKNQKSQVLDKIANELTTQQDPPARFVRFEPKHQRWYEIEAFYAREKISQCCRDIAQDGYRSANTFKNLKRRKSSVSFGQSTATDASGDHKQRTQKKKTAAQKHADTNGKEEVPGGESANQLPSSRQSKRAELERQIELLKKELEQLDQEEQHETDEGALQSPKTDVVVAGDGGEMGRLPMDDSKEEVKPTEIEAGGTSTSNDNDHIPHDSKEESGCSKLDGIMIVDGQSHESIDEPKAKPETDEMAHFDGGAVTHHDMTPLMY